MSTVTSRCPHCNKKNRIASEKINTQAICGACKEKLFVGKPITGNAGNLAAIIATQQPCVIDFWAPWCGPCVSFATTFAETAVAMQSAAFFVKVDTETEQALGTQYQIRSIPTIVLFNQGKLTDQLHGALPKAQFQAWLQQALAK